jgi:hypothetical protein
VSGREARAGVRAVAGCRGSGARVLSGPNRETKCGGVGRHANGLTHTDTKENGEACEWFDAHRHKRKCEWSVHRHERKQGWVTGAQRDVGAGVENGLMIHGM